MYIAVCAQWHTTGVVIDDRRRALVASLLVRGRGAGRWRGRRRPSALAASSRRLPEARACGRSVVGPAPSCGALRPAASRVSPAVTRAMLVGRVDDVGVARAVRVVRAGGW